MQEEPRWAPPVFLSSAVVPQPAEGERPEPWMNAAMGSRVPACEETRKSRPLVDLACAIRYGLFAGALYGFAAPAGERSLAL